MSRSLERPHSGTNTSEPRARRRPSGRSRALAHPSGPPSGHDGFSTCSRRDLKASSRTSWTTLLVLQAGAARERGLDASRAVVAPICPIKSGAAGGGRNFDRRYLSAIVDSGARPYMPGKRATSRVERAIKCPAVILSHRAQDPVFLVGWVPQFKWGTFFGGYVGTFFKIWGTFFVGT